MNPPLHGLRVLDFSSVMMGPLATQILADQGADVICVEGPSLSTQRQLGPGAHPELSGVALNLLRNKRSVQLDVRTGHGRRAFLALADTADIVVTNLRPSSLAKLGLGYAEVSGRTPMVVWCEAHGYSPDTGDPDAPMYDDIAQAASGLPDLMVRGQVSESPRYLPTVLADKVCAYAIAQAVLAGLAQRSRTGRGTRIEVAMVDVVRSFVLAEHAAGATPVPEVAPAGYGRVLAPHRRPHPTTDGYLAVMPYSPADWRAAFVAFERPDLADDERLTSHRSAIEHAPALYAILGDVLARHSTQVCLDRLTRAGVACARLATLDDMVGDCPIGEHPAAGPYRLLPTGVAFDSRVAGADPSPAPLQGEHTESILRELGVADADLAACLGDVARRAGR